MDAGSRAASCRPLRQPGWPPLRIPVLFFGDIVKDWVMVWIQTEPDMKHSRRPSPMGHADLKPFYALARERYAALGVDVDHALKTLGGIPLSLHCWQGDDVSGFEHFGSALGGGLAVT